MRVTGLILALSVCALVQIQHATATTPEAIISPSPSDSDSSDWKAEIERLKEENAKLRQQLSNRTEVSVTVSVPSTWSEIKQQNFFAASVQSVSMIIVSELGDKTFFIAAIMAMKHSPTEIFFGAMSALAVMTVLSAALGFSLPNLLPREYTQIAATLLFCVFGIRLLRDAYQMQTNQANLEELEEVEEELTKKELEHGDLEADKGKPKIVGMFSATFIQCFTMTFVAEWGDRSQIATIALAAAKDPFGVSLGAILGHSCCTALAVYGGKMLATRISERMVAFMGGVLFLVFALHALVTEHFA